LYVCEELHCRNATCINTKLQQNIVEVLALYKFPDFNRSFTWKQTWILRHFLQPLYCHAQVYSGKHSCPKTVTPEYIWVNCLPKLNPVFEVLMIYNV
jgi:hypothetical protein